MINFMFVHFQKFHWLHMIFSIYMLIVTSCLISSSYVFHTINSLHLKYFQWYMCLSMLLTYSYMKNAIFCMSSTKSTLYALTKFILGLQNVFIFQFFLSLLSLSHYIEVWSQFIDSLYRLPYGMSRYIT